MCSKLSSYENQIKENSEEKELLLGNLNELN